MTEKSPTIFYVTDKDCKLCQELAPLLHNIHNPMLVISAGLLGVYKQDVNTFNELMDFIISEWIKYEVTDKQKGKVENPSPFIIIMGDTPESYIGDEAFTKLMELSEVERTERMKYLCEEYRKRKEVVKHG